MAAAVSWGLMEFPPAHLTLLWWEIWPLGISQRKARGNGACGSVWAGDVSYQNCYFLDTHRYGTKIKEWKASSQTNWLSSKSSERSAYPDENRDNAVFKQTDPTTGSAVPQRKKWCNRRESTTQRRAIIVNKSGGEFEGQHTVDVALMRSINRGQRNRVNCHFMEKHFQRRLTRSNGAIYGHKVWIVPICRKFPPFQHILHRQIHSECVGQHVKHYTHSCSARFLFLLLPYSTTSNFTNTF